MFNFQEYHQAAAKVYDFYFGNITLEENDEVLNIFTEMCTDMNFVYPAYESLQLHSANAKTFCYE